MMQHVAVQRTHVQLSDEVYMRQIHRRAWVKEFVLELVNSIADSCSSAEELETPSKRLKADTAVASVEASASSPSAITPTNFCSKGKKQKQSYKNRTPSGGLFREKSAIADVPDKYYGQRYRYWSLYDQGVQMDTEGWFSVTPEAISEHIANRCRCDVIIDPFCGCGGNAIQFAMTCHMVIAIDIDPRKIAAARINAAIYKVEHRIEFIVGDAMTILPQLKGVADVIFLSPPWGGPAYSTATEFDLNTMIPAPLNGIEIYRVAHAVTPEIVYFLPRNCSISQLSAMATEAGGVACEVETQWLNGKLKTKAAYFADLAVHAYTSSDDDDDDMFTNTASVTTAADRVKQPSSSSTHVRFTDDDDMVDHDAVAVSLPLTTVPTTVDQCKEDNIYSQWDRKTVDTTHHKELSNAIAKGSSAYSSMHMLHAVCSIFNAGPTTLCTQVNKIFEARLRAACIAEELGEDSSAKFTFTLVKRPGAAELPSPAGVRVEIRDPLAARIYLGTLGQ
eukprot:21196-Heterococcus_DN1.PRE.1